MLTLPELNSTNITSLSIDQLTMLHRGVHRNAKAGGDYDLLMSSHALLATELERKGVGHGTPLDMPKPSIHAIYLKSPHGTLIAEGKKRAIAKSHPINGMEGKRLIVSKENGIGLAFGAATIGEPEQINAGQFDKRFEEHRVTSKERNRWWPGVDKFALYPIVHFTPYDPPRHVEVPAGTQTLMTDVKFAQPDLIQLPNVTKIVTELEEVKENTMPWKVFKRGNEWCVFKITPDEKPTGSTLGCHLSEQAAQAQVRALFAAEDKARSDLPDSAFLYIEPGGTMEDGRTKPDRLRHLPYKNQDGSINLPQLRNALSRLGQPATGTGENRWLTTALRERLIAKAQRILAAQRKKAVEEVEAVIDEVLAEPTLVNDVKVDVPTIAEQVKAAVPNQTTCTCPNCKQVTDHEPGITCNEVECASCGSMLRGGGKESDEADKPLAPEVIQAIADIVHAKIKAEREGAEVVVEPKPAAPAVVIKSDEPIELTNLEYRKAGRRVRKDRLAKLKELFNQLKELLSWAAYEDDVPEPMLPVAKAFKGRDGRTWLMLWTTNSYKDRDDEIFRIKAIEDYVKRYDNNPIKGEFQFWHIPGTKFGDIVWQAIVADRFLVQMGTFDDTPIGNAFKAFLTSYPNSHPNIAPTGWGASHGYNYIDSDRRDGVYDWFNTVESSVLPMVYAANLHNPNPIVLGGKEMDAKQTAALREIGKELEIDLVELVTKVGERKKAEIDEFVEHKSKEGGEVEAKAETETPTTETKPTESEPEVTKSATEELQTSEEGAQPDMADTVKAIVAQVTEALELQSLSDALTRIETQVEQSAKVAQLDKLTERVTQLEQSDEKKIAQRMDTMPRLSWMRASRVKETILDPETDKDLIKAADAVGRQGKGPVLPIPKSTS